MNEISKRIEFYKALALGEGETFGPEHSYAIFKRTLDLLQSYLGSIQGKRILDVGCGWNAPQTILLSAAGAQITGIDTKYIAFNEVSGRWIPVSLRKNGLTSTVKLLFYRQKRYAFYSALSELSGLPVMKVVNSSRVDIRQGDVTHLEFPDGHFDSVISNSVLEHVKELDVALKEIARVTRMDGVTLHEIHLFPSPSGGHHPLWCKENFDHWDHLLEKNHYVPSDLNQRRLDDYVQLFSKYFEVLSLERTGVGEGKKWLTDKMKAKLKSYSIEDLTTRGVIILARRRV